MALLSVLVLSGHQLVFAGAYVLYEFFFAGGYARFEFLAGS
jgi:hypothetical protein